MITPPSARRPPEDRGRLSEVQEEVSSGRQAGANLDYRTNPANGPVRHLTCTIHRLADPGGGFHLAGTVIDLTAQREAEDRLHASERRFQALVENSSDAIALFDAAGVVIYVSPAAHRILGFEESELVGRMAAFAGDPGSYDVVVSDHNMPTVSGIDLLRQVSQRRPDLPLILASGLVSDQLEAEAREAGVARLVAKPNSYDALAEIIGDLVGAEGEPDREHRAETPCALEPGDLTATDTRT